MASAGAGGLRTKNPPRPCHVGSAGGLCAHADHRLEKMADRQVQQALDGVFKKLRALGSARQTMRWDRDAQLPLPEVHPGTAGHDIIWQLPRGHRMHQMLTNPCSAGALVYGRTETKTVIEDGRARQSTRRTKPLEQWRIVLLEQHPGDISWDMFLQNHQLLEANRAMPAEAAGGAAKRGPALLQWLAAVWALRPQAPGRLSRHHRARATGCVPGRPGRPGLLSSCLTVGGRAGGPQPAGVQAAFTALDRVETAHDTQRQAVE